jgi:hypothetical protein
MTVKLDVFFEKEHCLRVEYFDFLRDEVIGSWGFKIRTHGLYYLYIPLWKIVNGVKILPYDGTELAMFHRWWIFLERR